MRVFSIIAVVMFVGCEPIPTSYAGDPHHTYEPAPTIIHKTVEKKMISGLSLSFAAQQFDFNSNRKQWSVGLGKAEDEALVPSVGFGGTVTSGGNRLLLNTSFGIERGKKAINFGISGRM